MAKTCVLALLQFLIPIGAYTALLWQRVDWPLNLVAGVLLGVFMAIAIGLIWQAIHKLQDLSLLKASAGQMPVRTDGERVAVFGKIYPQGEAFKSPFSETDCVCCIWGITRVVSSGSGKNRSTTTETLAKGQVLIPSYVRTGMEDVKLLGFPELEGFLETEFGNGATEAAAYQKAKEYLEKMPVAEDKSLSNVKEVMEEAREFMTDSDGAVRSEYRYLAVDELSPEHSLEEKFVPSGAEICLMGKWSAAQRGIVPEDLSSGRLVTIRKGSAEQVASALLSSATTRIALGLVIGLIVNAIVWFVVQKFPLPGA